MAELPINANISEVDGAYYPVRLEWVPRVGELISLYSFIDQVDGNQPTHQYEVVQVVHEVYDITDKTPHGHKGMHFVLSMSSVHRTASSVKLWSSKALHRTAIK